MPIRAWAGLIIVFLIVLVAVLAPLITSHDPVAGDLQDRRTPPFWLEGGTQSHPLGTDYLGRDVWSRLVHGARTSLIVALGALAIGGTLGTAFGFLSGYYRGSKDRIFDTTLPPLISPAVWLVCCALVAIWLVFAIGVGLTALIVALGLMTWPRYIKPIRSEVMRSEATQANGPEDEGTVPPHYRSNVRLLLPRVASALPGLFVSQMGFLIILEPVLSFLGVGVPPPTPSWGGAVWEGWMYFDAWWIWAFPLICIALLSAGFYMMGNWLSDRRRNSLAAP